MPLPNPSFEPKSNRWQPRGVGTKSGGALLNLRSFGPKASIFRLKWPANPGEAPKRRETGATAHVWLDFNVSKSPLVPFNSMKCPRNGTKCAKKPPKFAQCAPTPRNQARAVSWATWLKSVFQGHLVHPQRPPFCGFQGSELPNEQPAPPYQWSLGGAGGQPSPRTVGGQRWVHWGPRGKKNFFFKIGPRPFGMLKQAYLGRFEPVVARFWPSKMSNAFQIGRFGT